MNDIIFMKIRHSTWYEFDVYFVVIAMYSRNICYSHEPQQYLKRSNFNLEELNHKC